MTSQLKGGKTPPRLIEDLSLYNPHRLPQSSYNVLTELTLPYDGNAQPPKKTGKGACRHKWLLKPRLCSENVVENRGAPAFYQVGAFCSDCRCHVTLVIDSRGEGNGVSPCPSEEFPLHHFRYVPERSPGFKRAGNGSSFETWEDQRTFQCSAKPCSARLKITMRSPYLKKAWIDILTDKDVIAERVANAKQKDPERFEGHAVPDPTSILLNLRSYIANALQGEDKRVLRNRKNWVLFFGDQSSDLFEYLGFTKDDAYWYPPRGDPEDHAPFSNELNILLCNVENELSLLINQRPEEERRIAKIHTPLAPALDELRFLLGCRDYARTFKLRSVDNKDELAEHPYYGGLGTVLDFHDSLLTYAYDRQTATDPGNGPYYLECLQGIADGRKSEDLQTKAVLEASSGHISTSDMRKAYTQFGFDADAHYDDDTIIGTFQSRVADAPAQENELRIALRAIGQHRNSHRIEQFASDTISTYEQALEWLGAREDTDESFLVSMYRIKIDDNASNERLARECITIIAEKKNSLALKNWLQTGELLETEMDPGQAYARLEISDRTVDDEVVLATYNLSVQDAPSQLSDLKRALAAIAKDRKSNYLLSFLDTGMVTADHKLSEWPVGLENIGNTCYLNSLLQFYFTVKPLRDLVLHFDDHRMEIAAIAQTRKQVGSRKVSAKEVQRAQKFVEELRKLFQNMITSDRAQVTPEQELARLTLLSSSTEEIFRRRSTLKGPRPNLGDIDGRVVQGPLLPPSPQASEGQDEKGQSSFPVERPNTPASDVSDTKAVADSSSEGTLVGDRSMHGEDDFMGVDVETNHEARQVLEDKENLAPSKEEDMRPVSPDAPLEPLAESSPSRINEQRRPPSPSKTEPEQNEQTEKAAPMAPFGPPNRPPPVPPRENVANRKELIQKEVEFGAQQDVTEAISNVLFQLQCAIKPDSIDESGEQIDAIKKLFFGKQKVTTVDKDGKARTMEEFFSDIKVQVAGPRDIYAALDDAFDEEEVEVGTSKETQFTTISLLPPILQIHISRAQFDKAKATLFKSNHHLAFKETIFMDRYVDSDDVDLKQRREECWGWKKDVLRFEKRKEYLEKTKLGMSMPQALRTLSAYLGQLRDADPENPIDVDPTLIEQIDQSAVKADQGVEELAQRIKDTKAKIASQFTDLRSLPYRLHSVFIHRGMVSSGHYWIYILDFARGIWRKYNDGYVTEVRETHEIFETEDSPRPATSSFLVYVKEGMEQELTDAVLRDVVDPPPPAPVAPSSSPWQQPGRVDAEGDMEMIGAGEGGEGAREAADHGIATTSHGENGLDGRDALMVGVGTWTDGAAVTDGPALDENGWAVGSPPPARTSSQMDLVKDHKNVAW